MHSGAIKFPEDNITGSMTNAEVIMIGFILLLWVYVIRIFLQKWGKDLQNYLVEELKDVVFQTKLAAIFRHNQYIARRCPRK